MKLLLVILFLAHSLCLSAPAPEIVPLTAKYRAAIDGVDAGRNAAVARVARDYQSALDAAEKTAIATGDVKPLAAIATERDAVKTGKVRLALPSDLPKALLPAQKSYVAGVVKVDAETTPRRQRALADYLRALVALEARSAGNADLRAQIAAEKEAVVRGMPVDTLDITKRLIGSTWRWADKETVTFMDHGKGRWSVGGGKEITWKVTDAAARRIEGINGKGNPFTIVMEPSLEEGHLVEKGGSSRDVQLLPTGRK